MAPALLLISYSARVLANDSTFASPKHFVIHFVSGIYLPDSIAVNRRSCRLKLFRYPRPKCTVVFIKEIPEYLMTARVEDKTRFRIGFSGLDVPALAALHRGPITTGRCSSESSSDRL